MSPRPYRLGQRQVAVDETRARVVAAARELLMSSAGARGFTIDAVARKAGVARMTVYYHFASKRGLLEALFEDLADRGRMEGLAEIFTCPDPRVAVERLVEAFAGFWATDRLVFRRLRSLAALDADLASVLRSREERRRAALRHLVARAAEMHGVPRDDVARETVDVLFTLTSFETFDTLAGTDRSLPDVAPAVVRLARSVLADPGGPGPPPAPAGPDRPLTTEESG